MNTFNSKGYGRIFVREESHIAIVHQVIKELDEDEFTTYMPRGLVVTLCHFPTLTYLGKFDSICKNAIAVNAWMRGAPVLIVDQNSYQGDYALILPITKEK